MINVNNRRGGQAAEGERLEKVCMGNPIKTSESSPPPNKRV